MREAVRSQSPLSVLYRHEELTALFGMLAAGGGPPPPVFSKLGQLTEWIEEGTGGLLHFAGDNAVDADGHSSFPLRDVSRLAYSLYGDPWTYAIRT